MIVYSLDELIDLRRAGGTPPFDDVAEAMFLTEAIDCYLAVRSPFAGAMRPVLEEMRRTLDKPDRLAGAPQA